MEKAPCADCERRSPVCHASCPEYLEWDAEHRDHRERIKQEKMREGEYIAHVKLSRYKTKKRRDGWKMKGWK